MKIIITVLIIAQLCFSCANNKTFIINDKNVTIEPYGLFNQEELKDNRVIYKISVGNIVLDCLFFSTILVPVLLIGYELYEPVKLKNDSLQNIRDTIIINYK